MSVCVCVCVYLCVREYIATKLNIVHDMIYDLCAINAGVDIEMEVLANAGHHLYLDNSNGFHDYIARVT